MLSRVNTGHTAGHKGRKMVSRIELELDVSDAAGLGEVARIAVSITLPDPSQIAATPIICFARPGGGYSREYYTCDLPGPARGAQADFHAVCGWIFVSMDHLGCGASSRHDGERLDFAVLAAATLAAERDILLRLANGVLSPGFPPINQPVVIGMGQSVGGALAIYQQGHYHCYDGLVVLGFSAVHSRPMSPPGEPPIVVPWFPRDLPPGLPSSCINAAAVAAATANGPQSAVWSALAWGFHYDDVAPEIVEQDLLHYEAIAQGGTLPPGHELAPWNSYITPQRAARSTLTPGVVASEAAAVTVPVLSAMGVRDLVADPAGEVRAFLSAPSVDSFICPRMGHMHNFASTRALLWQRIDSFGAWCAGVKAAG